MRSFETCKRELLKDPAVKAEYDRLAPEFDKLRAETAAEIERKRHAKIVAKRKRRLSRPGVYLP